MLSCSPVEKYQTGKKSKKKYQKFNISQETPSTTSRKFENTNVAWKKETAGNGNTFKGFVDLIDFPELKVPQKRYESSCIELKMNKSWLPDNNANKKKLVESFNTTIPIIRNYKTGEKNFFKEKENFTDINTESGSLAGSKANTEVGTEKQLTLNINQNKERPTKIIKKSQVQSQKNPNKKKRADPIYINFQDILDVNKNLKKRKRHNIFKTKVQKHRHEAPLSGNFLDSSNPVRSRGKHREIKKKKLTALKTSILKERILKKKMKEIADGSQLENECYNLIDKIDFNKEIKTYLNELDKRKFKNSKNNKSNIKDNLKPENNHENQKSIGSKLVVKKEENSENDSNFTSKEIPQVTSEGNIKFSSKFREYCDNMITPNLNSAVSELIKELIKYQDKLFLRDPIKAKMHKRHVSGIREVKKYLNLKKVKMVIIAPNLEKLQMEGGVYDLINELKSVANNQNVPYGFALNRYKLGMCTRKNVPVSAFAVLNYEGAEMLYKNALDALNEAKKKFDELIKPARITEKTDVNSQVISILISAFHEDLQISNETFY